MRLFPHPPPDPFSLTGSRGSRRRCGVLMLSAAPLPLRVYGQTEHGFNPWRVLRSDALERPHPVAARHPSPAHGSGAGGEGSDKNPTPESSCGMGVPATEESLAVYERFLATLGMTEGCARNDGGGI
jgi:hypothetical protein